MARYQLLHRPTHALADKYGNVLAHRFFLYNAIGDGVHLCHWCQEEVRWLPGRGSIKGALQVDHVNGNKIDNSLENIVPSCHACNARRGTVNPIRENETFKIKSNGKRVRTVAKTCTPCGKIFFPPIDAINRGEGVSCSRSCSNRLRYLKVK